jgi:hypothetical protein
MLDDLGHDDDVVLRKLGQGSALDIVQIEVEVPGDPLLAVAAWIPEAERVERRARKRDPEQLGQEVRPDIEDPLRLAGSDQRQDVGEARTVQLQVAVLLVIQVPGREVLENGGFGEQNRR